MEYRSQVIYLVTGAIVLGIEKCLKDMNQDLCNGFPGFFLMLRCAKRITGFGEDCYIIGFPPSYHDEMITEIRKRFAWRTNITQVFDLDLKIVVDNLDHRLGFNESDYVISMCYFKRIASAVVPIISDAQGMSERDLVCHNYMNELNDEGPNLPRSAIVTIKNKAYHAQGTLDHRIRAYCMVVKKGRLTQIHDLLHEILRVLLKDDPVSKILQVYVKNAIKEIESVPDPANYVQSPEIFSQIDLHG
ncbi:hypothetical protein RF11_14983 [Thelohanellus kitauei]|uniref:Uncharacterized protein n=1 Tax=Thelohanellus kitauei TaxID=669202 RepID=A0A0C2NID7_THEKT|nr:hypothetical protein RF11_14983 [Thelohanellus kitauei]